MVQQTLGTFAKSLQKCFPIGTEGYNSLAETVQKLKATRERWPDKIFQLWKTREVPVCSSEDITKNNQSFTARLENVNEQRRRLRTSQKDDIGRLKKRLDDLSSKRDKVDDIYEAAEVHARTQRSLLNPADHDGHTRCYAELSSAHETYVNSMSRLTAQERSVREELTDIELDFMPIQLLSCQSNQKHLIVNKHSSLLGWMPSEDQYVLIQNPKPPTENELWRRVSHEPETGLSNLPLSIYNLIVLADEVGATDAVLLIMITTYLRKYKHQILDILDTKKQSLIAIIEILSFHCSTDHEKTEVLQKLKSFKRDVNETFASAVARFESLYCFYLQLETPSTAENIRLMSYQVLKQIAQYLLSAKCGQAFGRWASQQVKNGAIVNKETIIRVITQVESHPELRLTNARHLPGSLITTLNLPLGGPTQT